jgi:hypothetical protein
MQKSELLLLDRLTQSSAYIELDGLYCSKLRIPKYLIPLSREFGSVHKNLVKPANQTP